MDVADCLASLNGLLDGALVVFPRGTVSMLMDFRASIMSIFAEQQTDPEDWGLVMRVIARIGRGEWTFGIDGCVDAYEVHIVPDAKAITALA